MKSRAMNNEITLSTGQCTCMTRNPAACGTTTLKTIGRWIIAYIHLVTAIIRKLFIQYKTFMFLQQQHR
jgi:hypothetical protein